MENLGRYLIGGGILLILAGAGLYAASRLGLPLGRLPGDVRIDGEGGTFYFPVATSIVVSVIITVLANLVVRLLRR